MKKRLEVYNADRAGRRCGKCSACCTTLAVEEIGKPDFTRCEHLKGAARFSACRIYADRPGSCAEWSCAWLRGIGGSHHRPDKSGIVLDVEESVPIGGFVVKVWEIRKGAAKKPRNRELIEIMCESHPKPTVALQFFPGDRRRFLGGNPQGVEAAQPILAGFAGKSGKLEVE